MEHLGEFVTNHWILVSAFVVLLYLVLSNSLHQKLAGFTSVGTAEAIQIVNKQKGVFLDIRDTTEFEKEHIADSVSLPLSKVAEDASLKDQAQPLVLVCASGQRAKTAAKQLKEKGFTEVYVLNGGLNTWKDAKLPLFS